MFEPTRGGTRGGQAEFKWSDVSADKDRENYLGHSINAPTGRWQKNKDVHWYNRDVNQDDAARIEEIRKVKEAEAEALAAALGFAPVAKATGDTPASGANATGPVGVSNVVQSQKLSEKEEKRRRKAERKEEKKAKKEARRAERAADGGDSDDSRRPRRRDRSRSRSPRRHASRDVETSRPAQRFRSPQGPSQRSSRDGDYDAMQREKERERDRRRWESSSSRNQPTSGSRWGRD